MVSRKWITAVTVLFFSFILWIIYLANTGQPSLFFDLVRAIPYGDKFGHALLFGTLTLGANITLHCRLLYLGRVPLLLGSLLVSLFVIVEELSQQFVASRTFDSADLFADAIGIGLFSILSLKLRKVRGCQTK